MLRRAFSLTAAALVVGAANLGAQTPNFAGNWTRIVDPNAPATGGGAPDAMTIAQDAKTMTMTLQGMNGNNVTIVYNLDGTDTRRTMTDGDGNRSETVMHAKWDASKLVVTMTRDASDAHATFVYSLDAAGHLVLVVTLPSPSGGDPVIHTVSYRKN